MRSGGLTLSRRSMACRLLAGRNRSFDRSESYWRPFCSASKGYGRRIVNPEAPPQTCPAQSWFICGTCATGPRPTTTYTRGPTLQKELRHLRDLGFIKNKKPIADLPASFQLNQYFDLTDKGKDRAQE